MKCRIDALYIMGYWPQYCALKGYDANDPDYFEQRQLDLVTVPPEIECQILGLEATKEDICRSNLSKKE